MLYGKFTARLKASAIGGVVTTFITMSDRKDEIDWEIVGGDRTHAQSNVFYKGIAEYGVHGGTHAVNGGVDTYHTYTIDWKSDSLTFSIDGTVVRTYLNDANAVSPLTPKGEHWFPSTASQIQFSVWDGCKDGNAGTCSWSGGPVAWSSNAFVSSFDYVDIQCYDDKNLAVTKWPASSPSRQDADPTQPTAAAGPLASQGKPNGNGGGELNPNVPSLPGNNAAGINVLGAIALLNIVLLFL
jgi:beta-glucanase (GH16 family)